MKDSNLKLGKHVFILSFFQLRKLRIISASIGSGGSCRRAEACFTLLLKHSARDLKQHDVADQGHWRAVQVD